MTSIEFSKLLFQEYKNFKEKSFKDKFITHKDILNLIANLSNENILLKMLVNLPKKKKSNLLNLGWRERIFFGRKCTEMNQPQQWQSSIF